MTIDGTTKMRLHKYMAMCGVASRRQSEKMIASGMVRVNDSVVNQSFILVNPLNDVVKINDSTLSVVRDKVYILLNKPRGVVTTASDQFGRKTVVSLIGIETRIYPVGRLDYDTEGMLVLTNDGDLAFKLTHPSIHVEKEYEVHIAGKLTAGQLMRISKGVDIGGYMTAPARIETITSKSGLCVYRVVIKEGKNRQIRKMFEVIGYKVVYLKRVRIGKLSIGDMKPGQWRYLSSQEVNMLTIKSGG